MTPALPLLLLLGAFADDPLPERASGRLGGTRMRVGRTVHGLQFAAAGRVLVAADADHVVGWDHPTGVRLFRQPYPPNESIFAGRVTAPLELALLLRDKDREVLRVVRMDLATGKCSPGATLDHGTVTQAEFRPDAAVVVSVQRSRLLAHDTATGKPLWEAALPQAPPHAPVFSRDGKTLAVEAEKNVWLFDAAAGKRTHTLAGIHSPAVSADGSFVAGAGAKDTLAVFRNGGRTHTLAAASAVGFTPDAAELFAAHDGGVRVFDPRSGKLLRELDVPAKLVQHLSPDGTVLCGETRDAVLLFDAKTGRRLARAADPPGLPTELHVRRGRVAGLLPEWGGTATWDIATGVGSLSNRQNFGGTLAGAVPGRHVYVKDDTVVVRHAETLAVLGGFTHPGAVPHLTAVCPGTGTVVVAGEVGVARWSPGLKEKAVLPTTANDRPAATAVAAAGEIAAVAFPAGLEGGRATVELFRGDDHRHTVRLDGEARKLALSADGGILAAECDLPKPNGQLEYAATVIATATGRVLFRTPPDGRRDAPLSVSACGRTVARTGAEHKTTVYEVHSGKARAVIGTVGEPVAVAVDGPRLFTAQPGGPVLVWRIGRPAAAEPQLVWAWLAGADEYPQAQACLKADPALAVRFAADHLKPVPPADPAKLVQWIRDLDAPQFGVRQAAARELRKLGELAAPALEAAADETKSSEVRQKVADLLAGVPKPDAETLRALRLVEVLEWQNTPAAVGELKRLAAGAPGAAVTRDAAAALARLK